MNTVARPATGLFGALVFATSGIKAASYWSGPSIRRSGRFDCASFVAARTLSTWAPDPDSTGRVADHRDARCYTECLRGVGALDRDIGERLDVGIRNDRTVAVHQNLLGQTHKEDRRNGLSIRLGLDHLKCGPDGIGC